MSRATDGAATRWSGSQRSRWHRHGAAGSHRRFKRGLAAAVAAGTVSGVAALPGSASASAPATAPPALVAVTAAPHLLSGMRRIAMLPGSEQLSGAIAMKPRNPAVLQQFATEVSTPGSSLFHHYISPARFAQEFGPTRASIAAVTAQLRSDGLRVGAVSPNGLLVHFGGSVARLSTAFHTSIASFRLADGSMGRGTTSAIRLPSSIAGSVQSVVGLDNLVHPKPVSLLRASLAQAKLHPAAIAPPSPRVAGGPNACAAAKTAATEYGGLTDNQIAASYGMNGLYSAGDFGAGKAVAIFELEPYSTQDIAAFDTCYFGATKALAMLSRLHTVPVDGGQQVGLGSGEAELDIQDVSAIAPQSNIYVYEAPNTEYGALDEYNQIITQDKAQEISSSWGLCETAVQTGEPGIQAIENTLFQEAAAQGQSVFSAAGDDGSDDCAGHASSPVAPVLSVDDPASQPFVTSVGGTTIDNATQPPVERVWNDGALWGAGGGGISDTWTEPAWQQASTVPGLHNAGVISQANTFAAATGMGGGKFCLTDAPAGSSATACRQTPDVSAQADEFTGAITIIYGGTWLTIGGTSSSTPLWAAMTADMAASSGCGSSGVGFINPELYSLASNPSAYAASFNDIKVGNNDIFGATGGLYPATSGYDMASGLGTPKVTGPGGTAGLAHYLCAAAAPASGPTVTGISPAFVPLAGGTVTVTGTGFANGSTSLIAGVQVGTVALPSSDVSNVTATSFDLAVPASVFEPQGTPAGGAGAYYVTVTTSNGGVIATSKAGPGAELEVVGSGGSSTTPVVTGVGASGGVLAGGNTVTVYGSGLAGATNVTFGGVAGSNINVDAQGNALTVTVPAFASGTTTCAAGDDPVNDVCQVQVEVTTPKGSSSGSDSTILQPYSGAFAYNAMGVFTAPPGCNCESAPQATEYDYFPAPHITSLTADVAANGKSYASENGTTVVTLTGKGFDILALEWLDLGGPPNQYSSFYFNGPVYVSGTELQFVAPQITSPPTTGFSLPVFVQTLASPNSGTIAGTTLPSNEASLTYAPVPKVTAVHAGKGPAAGSVSGGTKLTITGAGFTAASVVTFVDELSPAKFGIPFSAATSFNFKVVSSTEITLVTPAANAGVDDVQVCTTTGCSNPNPKADTFVYYPPGRPSVTSSSPLKGSAKGGTKVTIHGVNLGFVVAVKFGSVLDKKFHNAPALLDSGSTSEVIAFAPPGKAGTTVSIKVETLQSLKNGTGFTVAVKRATFHYTAVK